MGITNAIVTNLDGRDFPNIFKNDKFDRVLLDAPCTGLGIIARDPKIKQNKVFDIIKINVEIKRYIGTSIYLKRITNGSN